MLVFGDRSRATTLDGCLDDIEAWLRQCRDAPRGIVRHGLMTAALLAAGEMTQALADDVQAREGHDDHCIRIDIASRLTRRLAASLIASWRTGFVVQGLPDIAPLLLALRQTPADDALSCRTPEGFAFYAVYPEAYAAAAASLLGAGPVSIIGVRSIGTVLAAVVAEALQAGAARTLRPMGHPFARTVAASARMSAAVDADALHVVVDEGPGASGSSFASVADWLEGCGVSAERIVFMPSHDGPPGAMAAPSHLARWNTTRRRTVTFDGLILQASRPQHRLENWFTDLVGSPIAAPVDLSGGAWRARRRIEAPSTAAFERRKYLLHTAAGVWLLKFVGLGRIGEDAHQLARNLHAAGLVTKPVGLRHGFLIEQWHDEATVPRAVPLPVLADYIGHRARHCPAGTRDGADLATLCHMARFNTRERLGAHVAERLALDATLPQGPRIRIDGRLHRWEWLQLSDGRLLKADALDHHAAHDLIGCQDVGWDIAGAIVEFGLSASQGDALRAMVAHEARSTIDPRLIATQVLCYSAFQLGLWNLGPDAADHVARYERRLIAAPIF